MRRTTINVLAAVIFRSCVSNGEAREARILVGFAAGGVVDIIARHLARGLSDILGESVVVENKTGANQRLAIMEVMRDRSPLGTWIRGRVTMLGDAAHPTMPFLGQGACMAIEDSLLLGRAFAATATVHEALERYESARKTRATNVQLWTRLAGQELQNPNRPRKSAVDLDLLYYDPVSVPV